MKNGQRNLGEIREMSGVDKYKSFSSDFRLIIDLIVAKGPEEINKALGYGCFDFREIQEISKLGDGDYFKWVALFLSKKLRLIDGMIFRFLFMKDKLGEVYKVFSKNEAFRKVRGKVDMLTLRAGFGMLYSFTPLDVFQEEILRLREEKDKLMSAGADKVMFEEKARVYGDKINGIEILQDAEFAKLILVSGLLEPLMHVYPLLVEDERVAGVLKKLVYEYRDDAMFFLVEMANLYDQLKSFDKEVSRQCIGILLKRIEKYLAEKKSAKEFPSVYELMSKINGKILVWASMLRVATKENQEMLKRFGVIEFDGGEGGLGERNLERLRRMVKESYEDEEVCDLVMKEFERDFEDSRVSFLALSNGRDLVGICKLKRDFPGNGENYFGGLYVDEVYQREFGIGKIMQKCLTDKVSGKVWGLVLAKSDVVVRHLQGGDMVLSGFIVEGGEIYFKVEARKMLKNNEENKVLGIERNVKNDVEEIFSDVLEFERSEIGGSDFVKSFEKKFGEGFVVVLVKLKDDGKVNYVFEKIV